MPALPAQTQGKDVSWNFYRATGTSGDVENLVSSQAHALEQQRGRRQPRGYASLYRRCHRVLFSQSLSPHRFLFVVAAPLAATCAAASLPRPAATRAARPRRSRPLLPAAPQAHLGPSRGRTRGRLGHKKDGCTWLQPLRHGI